MNIENNLLRIIIMNNRNIIIITILLTLVTIIGGTIIKVQADHQQKESIVLEKRITESAQECIFQDICNDNKITLGFLIEKGFASEIVNPKTKMYYSHDSYVLIENNQFTFIGL